MNTSTQNKKKQILYNYEQTEQFLARPSVLLEAVIHKLMFYQIMIRDQSCRSKTHNTKKKKNLKI